jgi:hypothetical protein
MTEEWWPDEALREWAEEVRFSGAEVVNETAKFVDHFLATGKPMKDWGAAWKNWMRRSRDFAPARASPNGRGRAGINDGLLQPSDAVWDALEAQRAQQAAAKGER